MPGYGFDNSCAAGPHESIEALLFIGHCTSMLQYRMGVSSEVLCTLCGTHDT